MVRVDVQPTLLRWAIERSGADEAVLWQRFPKLDEWESRERRPTLKQLEAFAKATHTPVGYFFLRERPREDVPIPDFRTVQGKRVEQPSPNLLDTIYLCQQRQEWYREYARTTGETPLDFVGSLDRSSAVKGAAEQMRRALGFAVEQRKRLPTWEKALRYFIDQAEDLGVLVMVSGVVGGNPHRKLDPAEFRGFALADPYAPLVFINGADTKAAQMFTLAHELAHIWLGVSALSNAVPSSAPDQKTERWCNQAAAELLVPLAAVRNEHKPGAPLQAELDRLARVFKVSTLVILRRIHDAGRLTREHLWEAYEAELERVRALAPSSSGRGNFYRTTAARTGKRFARAVVISALEGQTLYTEAFRMLGCRKMATFKELGRSVGVDA